MASDSVAIEVDAAEGLGPWRPIWNWFGYDEPNYTYAPGGRALLGTLAGLHEGPVYVRMHNLLTSGDGTAALKWGSTGAYREDGEGRAVYDWTITDRIFDALVEAGVVPFVQVGFMPEALSTEPVPYRHDFPRSGITTGWACPPRDDQRWGALVSAWAGHLRERYGRAVEEVWPWEVWNEPDGLYWRGSADEFCRLYDVTVAAVTAVLPGVRIGGPHTCSPDREEAAAFLRHFLGHCTSGRNHVTGAVGSRLDFVAFHAKGQPALVEGRVRMGLRKQMRDIARGLEIVGEFPALAGRPVILGESDPEGCAACSAAMYPENVYRDGPVYGAYVVQALARTMELSARAGRPIEGSVTWAFTFEGERPFVGLRELATNGVDKAVLNAFRLMGRLGGERLAARSGRFAALAEVLEDGVPGAADLGVLATRDDRGVSVLVWHYGDDEEGPEARVELTVRGVAAPSGVTRWRVDGAHGNAHRAWREMGEPDALTAGQVAALRAVSGPVAVDGEAVASDGQVRLAFALPRHGVSLVRLDR